MNLYDVDGYDRPLLLSEEHAEVLGARLHATPAETPHSRASKAEWADYALGTGADPEYVGTLTRAQLLEQFGG